MQVRIQNILLRVLQTIQSSYTKCYWVIGRPNKIESKDSIVFEHLLGILNSYYLFQFRFSS